MEDKWLDEEVPLPVLEEVKALLQADYSAREENHRLRMWCGILVGLNLLTVAVLVYEFIAWHRIFAEMS